MNEYHSLSVQIISGSVLLSDFIINYDVKYRMGDELMPHCRGHREAAQERNEGYQENGAGMGENQRATF